MNTAMNKRKITLEVSTDAAEAFESAPEETRQQLEDAITALLRDRAFNDATCELEHVMDEIGTRAEERGLTMEKLNEILYAS